MPLIARPDASAAPDSDHGIRELEARAGVFDLEEALAERFGLVDYFARLDAVVGPGGTKDDDISSYWHVLEAEHRLALQESGEKVTEGKLDTLVYADERYIAKLEEFRSMREQWVLVKNEIDSIDKRIQWAMALVRYAASEPKT